MIFPTHRSLRGRSCYVYSVSRILKIVRSIRLDLKIWKFEKRDWSSGRIYRCHRCDPGSIPGSRIFILILTLTVTEPQNELRFIFNAQANTWNPPIVVIIRQYSRSLNHYEPGQRATVML